MIKASLEITKKGKTLLDPDVLEVKLNQAVRKGVEAVMQQAKRDAENLAEQKGIVPDTGPKADKPYNRSFKIRDTKSGKKLEWSSNLVNDAADAKVQEYGRKPGSKMPPSKPIEEWMERKKLFAQDFHLNKRRNSRGKLKQKIQPRNKLGQFQSYPRASRSQRIWLMRKKIQKDGRKAHFVIRDLKRKMATNNARQRMLKAIKDYLR